MPVFTAQAIATKVGGKLIGQADLTIHGLEQIATATPGQLTFIRDEKFAKAWATSKASAALVNQKVQLEPPQPGDGRALIFVADADLAMNLVLELFAQPIPQPAVGVSRCALVDPTAVIDPAAAVGPACIIGPRVRIGPGAVLHPRVTLMDDVSIGAGSVIYPGVVIRERCVIGQRVIIHSNAVIGADGFGYRPAPGGKGMLKVPHLGNVVIHDDVEIGANTTIDRAKFSSTVIGSGTKIDNLCQIAHNCQIGRSCLLAAQVGIAGSAVLGDGVMVGGQSGVRDNVTIGAGCRIAAHSAVAEDMPPKSTWGGTPARDLKTFWREHSAVRKLPAVMKRVEKTLGREKAEG